MPTKFSSYPEGQETFCRLTYIIPIFRNLFNLICLFAYSAKAVHLPERTARFFDLWSQFNWVDPSRFSKPEFPNSFLDTLVILHTAQTCTERLKNRVTYHLDRHLCYPSSYFLSCNSKWE